MQQIVDTFVETTKEEGGKTSVYLDPAMMRDMLVDEVDDED